MKKFKFLDVGGYRTRYAESPKGSGNVVLLIHGLGGSAESWANNIGPLGRQFHVFAPDLIGFGMSEKPPVRYTMRFFTKFLHRFMQRTAIRRASLVGSSMGGQIAAEFALEHPGSVERLVLVSPAGIPPKEFRGTKELWSYARIFDARNLKQVRDALRSLATDDSPIDEEYVKSVYQYKMMEGAKHAFFSSLRGSGTAPRLVNRLSNIDARTLVVWGKEDRMIPARYSAPFITKMPDCRLLIVERCGHRPHFEKPSLFNRTVIDFLKEE